MGRDFDAVNARLHRMLAELDDLDRLGQAGERTVELDQQAVGRLSRMDALQGQAMARAQRQRRDARRRRIHAALCRCDSGEYGYCASCGGDIGNDRLSSDPAAPLCLDCARSQ